MLGPRKPLMQPRSSGQCAATRSANAAVLQVSHDLAQLRPDWRSSAMTGPTASGEFIRSRNACGVSDWPNVGSAESRRLRASELLCWVGADLLKLGNHTFR